MVKESLSMWMEISMMASGLMIKLMDMEYISMLMERNMKENGKTIYSMVRVLRPGLMAPNMMVIMHLGVSMESDLISGMMALNTQEIGMKIKLVVLVFILGWMVETMRENGRITTWRD